MRVPKHSKQTTHQQQRTHMGKYLSSITPKERAGQRESELDCEVKVVSVCVFVRSAKPVRTSARMHFQWWHVA